MRNIVPREYEKNMDDKETFLVVPKEKQVR